MSASIPVKLCQADNSTHPSWSPTSTCGGSTFSVWLAKPDGTAEPFSATGANKKLNKCSAIRIEGSASCWWRQKLGYKKIPSMQFS